MEEDTGVNSDMWAGDPPVHSMGWENMFKPPEVGSLGWENMFDPLEVGSLG